MAFRFLKSFFTAPAGPPGKYTDAVIEAAIERVVDGTDPHLRAVRRYLYKLWDAVAHSINFAEKRFFEDFCGACRTRQEPSLQHIDIKIKFGNWNQ